MHVFKHRTFHRWARVEGLRDETLKNAIHEMEGGLYEANLGSGLYKKRVAMPGKGKRGGYRTLIAFKGAEKAIFVYAFAKNVRDNITEDELRLYRRLAKALLGMDTGAIQSLLDTGKLFKVK